MTLFNIERFAKKESTTHELVAANRFLVAAIGVLLSVDRLIPGSKSSLMYVRSFGKIEPYIF